MPGRVTKCTCGQCLAVRVRRSLYDNKQQDILGVLFDSDSNWALCVAVADALPHNLGVSASTTLNWKHQSLMFHLSQVLAAAI